MRITFCGAAKIVTGSCHFIEANNQKILVDCGMFQGRKEITRMNYMPFPFNPEEIDILFVTHAHIDHTGLIPKLVKEGFKGQIYATSATVDLTKALLLDSGGIHEMEIRNENRRRLRVGLPTRKPLYTKDDAIATYSLFHRMDYEKKYKINEFIEVRYRDAGHILGSSIIEMWIKEPLVKKSPFNKEMRKIVFSGDLGQWDVPIVKDPETIDEADYVLVESTYGNRIHEDKHIRDDKLLEICKETYNRGGKVMIPTFAVERTQELLYVFKQLLHTNKFPGDMKIFLDSPLAIKVTEIFKLHKECYDYDALFKNTDPFRFKNLEYTKEVRDSVRINNYSKPCVIMAGSGMCTAGRIRHHIKHNIWDAKNTLLFVGYQADCTLGKYLLSGETSVKMMGIQLAVEAKIEKIDGFSAHADKNELLRWMESFEVRPKKVFIVHGEEESQIAFKKVLQKKGFNCVIPSIEDSFEI
ncbi:MAG: MBL fold metallo-hydrolase [Nanoarchaeota archaeon]|nr:MBL fold metallo-hydrolase [Nanoarchaeota archaeon]